MHTQADLTLLKILMLYFYPPAIAYNATTEKIMVLKEGRVRDFLQYSHHFYVTQMQHKAKREKTPYGAPGQLRLLTTAQSPKKDYDSVCTNSAQKNVLKPTDVEGLIGRVQKIS